MLPGAVAYEPATPDSWIFIPESLAVMQSPSGDLNTEFVALVSSGTIEDQNFTESLGGSIVGSVASSSVAFTENPSTSQTGYRYARFNADADSSIGLAGADGFTLETYFRLSHEGCRAGCMVAESKSIAASRIEITAERALGESYFEARWGGDVWLIGTGEFVDEVITTEITLGTAHHLALSVSANTAQIYFNGAPVGSSFSIAGSAYDLPLDHFGAAVSGFSDSRNEPPFPGSPTYPERTVQTSFARYTRFARYSESFTPPTP